MTFKRQAWHIDAAGYVLIIIFTFMMIWIVDNRPGTHSTTDIIMERQSDVDANGRQIKKFDVCKDGTTSQNGECPEGQGI